jgi:hypothetical protein
MPDRDGSVQPVAPITIRELRKMRRVKWLMASSRFDERG